MSEPPTPAPVSVRPRRRLPYVTWAIILANTAVFLAQIGLGKPVEAWILAHLAQDRIQVWDGELWRLLTAIFVHETSIEPVFLHIGMNMLLLFLIGRQLESFLGWWRFLAVYLGSGLAGAFAFQALSSGQRAVGASGAVYGVFGAFVLLATSRTADGRIAPGWRFIRLLVILVAADQVFAYLVSRAQPGIQIGVSAHFGGLVAGAALAFVLAPRPAAAVSRTARVVVAVAAAALFLGLGIYGCFFTVHDRQWHAMAEWKAFPLDERQFHEAIARWRGLRSLSDSEKRMIGYFLFEKLMAARRDDLGKQVLDELTVGAEKALKEAEERQSVSAELLNEVAWYHAIAGTDLEKARRYAEEAVRAVRAQEPRGWWKWLSLSQKGRMEESLYLNTRGWIYFHLGKVDEALRDLAGATELVPLGVNFVYLALAENSLGRFEEAREAVKKAEQAGVESPYESRLLEDLKAELGGF